MAAAVHAVGSVPVMLYDLVYMGILSNFKTPMPSAHTFDRLIQEYAVWARCAYGTNLGDCLVKDGPRLSRYPPKLS